MAGTLAHRGFGYTLDLNVALPQEVFQFSPYFRLREAKGAGLVVAKLKLNELVKIRGKLSSLLVDNTFCSLKTVNKLG